MAQCTSSISGTIHKSRADIVSACIMLRYGVFVCVCARARACVCVCEQTISAQCAISGFRHYVDEICALMGYCAALSGFSVPTFRYNLSVPSSKAQKSKKKALAFLALQDGTDRLYRNVGYITSTQRCVRSQNNAELNSCPSGAKSQRMF
jgi:hypothetical protein